MPLIHPVSGKCKVMLVPGSIRLISAASCVRSDRMQIVTTRIVSST